MFKRIKPGLEKIEKAWNENPLLVIGIASGAMISTAKLITAVSEAKGRKAYIRQINAKVKNSHHNG